MIWLVATAFADPCDDRDTGMATGPVVAGLLDGDLGRARRTCARNELGLTGGALLTVDTPNFYGHIVAGGTLDGSWAIDDDTELFATLESFRYDTVISALTSTYVGFGHTTLGAHRQVLGKEGYALGVNGKVVLPTAFGLYENSWPFALDVGLAGLYGVDRFDVHWQISALASAAASKGPTQGRVGSTTTLGSVWKAGKAFHLVLDLHAGFGYTAALDVFAPALGFRFSDAKKFGMELGLTAPLAGRERALATVDLRATLRL